MRLFIAVLLGIIVFFMAAVPLLAKDKVITMSTTTSTENSGLLNVLLPEFAKDTGIEVKVMAKGTGAALKDGMDGNVDVVFVHDPVREKEFVDRGFGTKRYYVMYNDFVIVGPEADPAGIRGADATLSLQKIAAASAVFVSRGDDSGTHAKERELWQAAGLAMTDAKEPRDKGQWYRSIGQGMGRTLTVTNEMQGYTLTDRGTYISYKFSRGEPFDLVILVDGDDRLKNPYGVIPVNPAKHPHVKFDLADQFALWLVSSRGQELIGGYQMHGHTLFFPDAVK